MDNRHYNLDISVIKTLCIANEISAQLHHRVITEQVFYASLFLTQSNVFHKVMLSFGFSEDEVIDNISQIFFIKYSFLESKYDACSLKIGDVTFYVKKAILDILDNASDLAVKSNRSKIDLDVLTAIFTEKYPQIINSITKLITSRNVEKNDYMYNSEKSGCSKKSLPQIPFLVIILNS